MASDTIAARRFDKSCLSCWPALAPSIPSSWLRPPTLLRPRPAAGGSCAGCGRGPYRGYRAGGGGVGRPSWNPRSPARSRALRRWRPADPAGRLVLASGGSCRLRWLALAPSIPSSWLRPPTLLRSGQPAAVRPQRRGKDGRTGLIVEALEVLAVRPGILVLRLDPGR